MYGISLSILPKYLLSGTLYSFGRDGIQDIFNVEALGVWIGVRSNASFIFGALRRCSEHVYWITDQCRDIGSVGLNKESSAGQV